MGEFPESGSNCPNCPASPEHDELVAFLRACAAQGIGYRVDGDLLRVSSPVGGVTDELRARIQEFKPALLQHLATHRCSAQRACAGRIEFRVPTVCFWCREEVA